MPINLYSSHLLRFFLNKYVCKNAFWGSFFEYKCWLMPITKLFSFFVFYSTLAVIPPPSSLLSFPQTNKKGQVKVKSSVLKQMEELKEETGLTCCICREGYRYQPQKVRLAVFFVVLSVCLAVCMSWLSICPSVFVCLSVSLSDWLTDMTDLIYESLIVWMLSYLSVYCISSCMCMYV